MARPSRPVAERVEALVGAMTLDEKLAQLYGVWVGASDDGGDVAPHQHDLNDDVDLDELLPAGLGQLTRQFGTAPVDAASGALSLMRTQERIVAANRFGIPAVAHEECLAGFAAWGATAYPVPLSWGASFDPVLVERMSQRIGEDMRSVGVHQGLAPVLDVVRDARWGRVEETIGEDPYLVGVDRNRLRARARVDGGRRDAEALRRVLGVEGGPQSRARLRSAGGSSPTCCCRPSRWRCARAASAR